MNSEYDKQLERHIDRALRGLPELAAPPGLVSRVMTAVSRRAALPWYRQSMETWPVGLRAAAMVILLGSFSGLCIAAWQLTRAAGVTEATLEITQLFSVFTALWNALNVLLGAIVVVAKYFGTAFFIGLLAAIGLGYAFCVGLGTVYVRFAMARR
jgi:hypothetical protein